MFALPWLALLALALQCQDATAAALRAHTAAADPLELLKNKWIFVTGDSNTRKLVSEWLLLNNLLPDGVTAAELARTHDVKQFVRHTCKPQRHRAHYDHTDTTLAERFGSTPCGLNEQTCTWYFQSHNITFTWDWKHMVLEDRERYLFDASLAAQDPLHDFHHRQPDMLIVGSGGHPCFHTNPQPPRRVWQQHVFDPMNAILGAGTNHPAGETPLPSNNLLEVAESTRSESVLFAALAAGLSNYERTGELSVLSQQLDEPLPSREDRKVGNAQFLQVVVGSVTRRAVADATAGVTARAHTNVHFHGRSGHERAEKLQPKDDPALQEQYVKKELPELFQLMRRGYSGPVVWVEAGVSSPLLYPEYCTCIASFNDQVRDWAKTDNKKGGSGGVFVVQREQLERDWVTEHPEDFDVHKANECTSEAVRRFHKSLQAAAGH